MKIILFIILSALASNFLHAGMETPDESYLSALTALSEIKRKTNAPQLTGKEWDEIQKEINNRVIPQVPLLFCGSFANLLRELYLAGGKNCDIYMCAHVCLTIRLLSEKREKIAQVVKQISVNNLDGGWGLRVSELRDYSSGKAPEDKVPRYKSD